MTTPLDHDLHEVRGFLFAATREADATGRQRTHLDIQIAGKQQTVDADSHILTMTLPKGDEVEILLALRNQVQIALSTTYQAVQDEIDVRIAAVDSSVDGEAR